MKTTTITNLIVLGLMSLSTPIFAQMMHEGKNSEMPMDAPAMHRHMHEMADLMYSMAEVMGSGKMTPEEQVECSAYMKRLGDMMSNAAKNPPLNTDKKRADELGDLKKEWDYWRDQHEDH
jgi:hypothetical protein